MYLYTHSCVKISQEKGVRKKAGESLRNLALYQAWSCTQSYSTLEEE